MRWKCAHYYWILNPEVIAPSYTFVSTVNAFVLRGAKIIFADSCVENPNIDLNDVEKLITPKTRAIVIVHYAGIACDMDRVMKIASDHNLFVVEDAAQAIDSYYNGKPLGSIGHLAAFSFHETKNIISGEGGMLVVNDERFIKRAEIIREKGTNRSSFFRGEIDKYGWVDIGSSFLPSDIIAAFLYAQIENIDVIQAKRKNIWDRYYAALKPLDVNLVCSSLDERCDLIATLKENNVMAVFHYLSLHKSPYYSKYHNDRELPLSDMYSDCLVRLPLYFGLEKIEQEKVIDIIKGFYKKKEESPVLINEYQK